MTKPSLIWRWPGGLFKPIVFTSIFSSTKITLNHINLFCIYFYWISLSIWRIKVNKAPMFFTLRLCGRLRSRFLLLESRVRRRDKCQMTWLCNFTRQVSERTWQCTKVFPIVWEGLVPGELVRALFDRKWIFFWSLKNYEVLKLVKGIWKTILTIWKFYFFL